MESKRMEEVEEVFIPDKTDKSSTKYIFQTFFIGGLAGCAAKTVVAPLDRVKILFQTHNLEYAQYRRTRLGVFKAGVQIYKIYGIRGLFQGHSMQLARIYPYAAIKFMAYEQIKRVLIPSESKNTPIRHFLSGAGAGVFSVLFTYPFDMVRVRMAFETPKSSTSVQKARDFTRKIYNENIGGSRLISFYRGFSISMLGIIPYGGVSFLTHNYLIEAARTYFPKYAEIDRSAEPHKKRNRTKKDMRAWAELTAGGLSGIVAQTSSYPFELVRRRMQIGGINSPSKLLKAKDVVASIYKAEGVRGFFVGLTIGYIKVLPMFAVSFYTYEKLKSMLDIE